MKPWIQKIARLLDDERYLRRNRQAHQIYNTLKGKHVKTNRDRSKYKTKEQAVQWWHRSYQGIHR
jgi:hypothetical protein